MLTNKNTAVKNSKATKTLIAMAQDFHTAERLTERLAVLKQMPIIDISEVLSMVDNSYLPNLLDAFAIEEQGLIFSEFNLVKQLSYFQQLSKKKFSELFEQMPSDARADLFQILTQQEQTDLLPFLPKRIREDVIALSSYAPNTAGGIMNTDFATVSRAMTCAQAIEKVRLDAPSKKTIYYVYVVDENQNMQGFITLKDLIIAAPATLVSQVLHEQYISAYVDDHSELVAAKIDKYELVAIPILNARNQLVGIVTHDDAIDVIRAEHTEDMERFMGIISSNEELDYNQTSIWQHFKKRVVWLVGLAGIGIISGLIIHSYEGALEKMMILALYMPMVADTGGNSGSQSATVVIRALALGQISLKDWLRVIWKEARVSLLLAVCLGILAFAKVVFLSWETAMPGSFSLARIGFVIALALSLQVVSSTVIGAGLPILVRKFGGDPAVAASPAITTIVDISGLLIYFGLASAFFDI